MQLYDPHKVVTICFITSGFYCNIDYVVFWCMWWISHKGLKIKTQISSATFSKNQVWTNSNEYITIHTQFEKMRSHKSLKVVSCISRKFYCITRLVEYYRWYMKRSLWVMWATVKLQQVSACPRMVDCHQICTFITTFRAAWLCTLLPLLICWFLLVFLSSSGILMTAVFITT